MKPRLFIGSSTEGLPIARAIQEELQDIVYAKVWDQGTFKPSSTTLDDLLEILRESDFGIFVFSPDDILRLRERIFNPAR